jgi:hypothetical protein
MVAGAIPTIHFSAVTFFVLTFIIHVLIYVQSKFILPPSVIFHYKYAAKNGSINPARTFTTSVAHSTIYCLTLGLCRGMAIKTNQGKQLLVRAPWLVVRESVRVAKAIAG